MNSHKIALCILSRNYSEYWIDFLKKFKNHDVFLVIDNNDILYDSQINGVNIIQIPNETCIQSNYWKTSCWSNLPNLVAWDRSLYYFNRINTSYEHVWFLEEDVFVMNERVIDTIDTNYPDSDLLVPFHDVNESGDIHHGWNHWVNVIHRIGTPWAHSLVAASRLSRRLLDEVDNYLKDRHFMFIEALFSTLAHHNNLKIDHPEELKTTITYDGKWNPNYIDISKIYHPMKNIEEHKYIREHYSRYFFQ
jgi:hypothetical protein